MNNEEKILEMLIEMRGDIAGLKSDVSELKAGQAKLEAGQAKLESRQEKLESGFRDMQNALRHTQIIVEDQNKKISLIAEQHGSIIEKLDRLEQRTARNDDLRDRVETLEFIAKEHAVKLRELAKAE